MPENVTTLALPVPVEGDSPDVPRDMKALAERLGVSLPSVKSIIATEESRENAAYGLMPTPDEVTVTLPENGLIAVTFSAFWKESGAGAGARAAIFVGANQLKTFMGPEFPKNRVTQAAMFQEGDTEFKRLETCVMGLWSQATGISDTEAITTGVTLGGFDKKLKMDLGGTSSTPFGETNNIVMGGPCYITDLAAGTYKISVQYKCAAAKATVKNRKLRAWVVY